MLSKTSARNKEQHFCQTPNNDCYFNHLKSHKLYLCLIFLLQTNTSVINEQSDEVKKFDKMNGKQKAEVILSWFVGRDRAKDAVYQGELIDKKDMANKIPDVSNAATSEIEISLIEESCLGNTYDNILSLAENKKKSKSWQNCNVCKKRLLKDYVACVRCLCRISKRCAQVNGKEFTEWICLNCNHVASEGK